jgi:transposase
MIDMLKVQSIRTLYRNGHDISSIAKSMELSRPTVRKYLEMEDFNEDLPVASFKPSILDPYKEAIIDMLAEDMRAFHKQRHTAKRVFERLVDEYDYEGSYSLVQRYVKLLRQNAGTGIFLDLVWAPAEAQVDFGEADFDILGARIRMHYMVLSFPYSNIGLAQIFYGENAECVCEGLKRVFCFIGGVPLRIVFDNATGVGKRICNAISTTETFTRFQLHHGFEFTFCNPYAGHEKGNVENMVGALRRSLFVPVPDVVDLEGYNVSLFERCMRYCDKEHYRKGERCLALFEEDCAALRPLPTSEFNVVRYDHYRADKYGNVTVDSKYRYSTSPEFASTSLLVGFAAYEVTVYDSVGALIARHPRLYGNMPSESVDPGSSLRLLMSRPGAWKNSQVRYSLPEDLREFIDARPTSELGGHLAVIAEAAEATDYTTAVSAAWEAYRATGLLDATTVALYARHIFGDDGLTAYDYAADLETYDQVYSSDSRMDEEVLF